MRTTALLIFLVVLVSTGEALRCKIPDEGSDWCPPGSDDLCMHYKVTGIEMRGCASQRFCDAVKAALEEEGSSNNFMCCYEDLCN
uniref:Plethodontid modulating factor n=1 Tax=Plethodon ventralis TaxID=315413 RepID=Q0GAJ1_9SALA|nr:plethodontid modulating factor [Plethodon ventralis]